jgi:serine/threonine-protein kinase
MGTGRLRAGTSRVIALPALAALALLGCQRSGTLVMLRDWQLLVPGAPARGTVLPAHLDADLGAHRSAYALRARIVVPAELRGRGLTLAIPFIAADVSLRVDGEELTPVDRDAWERYRSSGTRRWLLPPAQTARPQLTLELWVSHRWPPSGWWDSVPRLYESERGNPSFFWVAFCNRFGAHAAIGTGILIGFIYLLVWLYDRRRKAHGWFAVGSAASAVYGLFWLGLTQPLFGIWDGPLLAFTVCVAQLAAIHFSHWYFDLPRPSRLWLLGAAVQGALCLLLHDPFRAVRWLTVSGGVYVTASIVYQLAILLPLLRRRSVEARPLLVCWLLVVLTIWPDYLWWLGLGQGLGGVHPACLGLALFPLIQAAALSRELTVSLAREGQLNVELADRVRMLEHRQRQIQVLNEELRRQVGDRSHQLSVALSRLSGGAASILPLLPGEVVEGRYRVLRALGEGGMGAVYEVIRIADGQSLALKILRARAAANLARFAREAEIVSQIDHPNVVSIVDVDVTRSGQLFLVMELVDGTLEEEQARYGQLDFALPVLRQMAEGLAAIHRKGVVHRDLKPSNVLLAARPGGGSPIVKIADFGIASLRSTDEENLERETLPAPLADTVPGGEGAAARLTRTGVIMGTIPYMAPELTHEGARAATVRSDLYSFGIIAYQLLAGHYPRLAGQPAQATPLGLALPPSARAPRPELLRLVDRCLDPDPAGRPSATDVLCALEPAPVIEGEAPARPKLSL